MLWQYKFQKKRLLLKIIKKYNTKELTPKKKKFTLITNLINYEDQNLSIGKNKDGNKSTEYLFRIVQLNIEGMTKSNAKLISHVFHYAEILAFQEIHISDNQLGKLKIPSFQLIDYIRHNKHGVATFVNQDLILKT